MTKVKEGGIAAIVNKWFAHIWKNILAKKFNSLVWELLVERRRKLDTVKCMYSNIRFCRE